MDRIINLKVVGNNITKDNDYAGVRGEANATKLKITFDESWSGYSKNVYFWDAHGENLVSIILTSVYWVDSNENIVLVPIPSEPLAVAGEMTIVIEGSKDGVKQVSATCNLKVLDSPENRDVINSPPPTDTELKQLQDGLADLASKVSEYVEVSEKIDGMTVEGRAIGANQSAAVAKSINKDGGYHLIFGIPRGPRGEKGDTGDDGPQGPAGRDGKAPYIGENGNWFFWDVASEQYKDAEVKAQGPKGDTGNTGSQGLQGAPGVKGNNGTDGKDGLTPDIGSNGNWWLGNKDTGVKAQGKDGKDGKAPYIGENGNWFEWDAKLEQYEDTGVKAQGEDGKQGKDGVSGLPNILYTDQYFLYAEAPQDIPAYTEVRITDVVNKTIEIGWFLRNKEKPGSDMWSILFTAGEGITLQEYSGNSQIKWAVADPVFTPGYTYYLSFIPLKDESAEDDAYFKGTILGVWVAKELTAE